MLCWLGTDNKNELRVYWNAGIVYLRVTAYDQNGFGDDTTETIVLTQSLGVYDSTWTHIAVVMDVDDSNYEMYLYLDGELDTRIDGQWTETIDSDWVFNGAKIAYGVGAYIDNYLLYPLALSEDQVLVLHDDGYSGGVSKCMRTHSGTSNPFEVDADSGAVTMGNTPVDYEVCTEFYLTATATDSTTGQKLACTFLVEVSDENDAPVMRQHTYMTVEEKTEKNTNVGEPLNATDVDFGQAILFTLNGSTMSEDDMFGIGKCSGQVFVNRNDLDYTVQRTYDLYIQAQDDGSPSAADYGWVHINVTNVNDAPYFTRANETHKQEFKFYENKPNGTGAARAPYAPGTLDPDRGDVLAFYMDSTDPTTSPFTIDRQTGAITAIKPLDYEENAFYYVSVRVSDGSLASSEIFLVHVEDQNDAPTLAKTDRSVDENSPNGTSVGSPITGADEDSGDYLKYAITGGNDESAFRMDHGGQLYVNNASALNYETTRRTFFLNVTATDHGGTGGKFTPKNVTSIVVVHVTDVNESPNAKSGQVFYLSENANVSSLVGVATANDPDNWWKEPSAQTLTFSEDGSGQTVLAIDGDGTITVADVTDLDFETAPTFNMSVKVRQASSLLQPPPPPLPSPSPPLLPPPL